MANDWFKYSDHTVTSVSEFTSLIFDELRSPYLFRGHRKSDWELEPVIDRPGFSTVRSNMSRAECERVAFKKFKNLSSRYLETRPANDWEFLALARHHGVPTRLLDWTENPLAALFFAIEEPTKCDSAVWCYTYIEQGHPLDVQVDSNPLDINRVLMYEPVHIHSRISSQASVFTVHPPDFKTFEYPWSRAMCRVTLPNDARPRLRLELQRLAVHRATLFQDLDGIGRYIYDMWRNE